MGDSSLIDGQALAGQERRALLLCKTSGAAPSLPYQNKYKMRHFWYNPHDRAFLRYAKDEDMRFVRIIPVKDSAMTMKENRNTASANTLIFNCHRKFKIKFAQGTKSWTLYFQSAHEFNEWLVLFSYIRDNSASNGDASFPGSSGSHQQQQQQHLVQEDWFASRYGRQQRRSVSSVNGRESTTRHVLDMDDDQETLINAHQQHRSKSFSSAPRSSPQALVARKVPVMVIVELPNSIGFMRLSLARLDTQVITVKRFKERLFEALHVNLHNSGSVHSMDNGEDNSTLNVSSMSKSSVGSTSSTGSIQSKYTKKRCDSCLGVVRQMMSRQMYQQEQVLEQGPDFFVLQVGGVFTSKDYVPSEAEDRIIRNEVFTRAGGLYQSYMESTEDDLLLKSFEFVAGKLGSAPPKIEDCLDWVEDESIAMSALVERTAPNRPVQHGNSFGDHQDASSRSGRSTNGHQNGTDTNGIASAATTVIHLVMRPSRELPLSKFFVSVSRYTREYDAFNSFSLYVATVRHGGLKWEIRRRFSDFKELDTSLREEVKKLELIEEAALANDTQPTKGVIDPKESKKKKLNAAKAEKGESIVKRVIPKLPHEARRTKWKMNAENDELRVIRELNVYLREAVTELVWDPPPVALLAFLGMVSTGKNTLMQLNATRKRQVCHLEALSDLAEFGDIILFRSVNPLAGIQRVVTGRCTFDHIGLVVKRNRPGYELLEATGEGVTAYPLEERLEAYFGGFCDLIALRKVRFERTEQASALLAAFASQVEGRPYKLTLSKLARSRMPGRTLSGSSNANAASRKSAYFCSELIAEALRTIGVMSTTGRPDSYFLPHFFDEGGLAEKYIVGGCSMDDIIFIDCRNPEIKYSKPTLPTAL